MNTKQCHKCDKETKLGFKCEHCGVVQQLTMSQQLDLFKGLSSLQKGLYVGGLIVVAVISFQVFSGSSSSSSSGSSSAKVCQLSGCNSRGDGWQFYTGSDMGAYSYSCVRLGPSTGHSTNYTYCSKSHCAQDQ